MRAIGQRRFPGGRFAQAIEVEADPYAKREVEELRERIKPKRMIITHMSARLDHAALTEYLPDGVEAAYDGMEIDVPEV